MHGGQPAIAAAQRRAGSFDDDDVVLGDGSHSGPPPLRRPDRIGATADRVLAAMMTTCIVA
jgi:hypothetical protein